jgi:hypothetical protein
MVDDYAQQTYVYSSSRHSMKDPVYISISDPVYDVDRPRPKVSPGGLRMEDDYANQTYVYSAGRHSMREPRYISISDPAYPISTK